MLLPVHFLANIYARNLVEQTFQMESKKVFSPAYTLAIYLPRGIANNNVTPNITIMPIISVFIFYFFKRLNH